MPGLAQPGLTMAEGLGQVTDDDVELGVAEPRPAWEVDATAREFSAHRVLLVEAGINIIETMALEELAQETARLGVWEFPMVVVPLPLVGATGSPVRPLALLQDAEGTA